MSLPKRGTSVTIQVIIRYEYGNERIYPVSFVEELRQLTKTKTLTREQVSALKALGFSFEVIRNVPHV